MKTRISGKQKRLQKSKRKYQQELCRKPKYIREFAKSLIVVMIVVFLIDLTFTYQAGEYYTNICTNEMQDYPNTFDHAIEVMHEYGFDNMDYADIVDGEVVFDLGEDEDRDAAIRAFMVMNFKAHYPSLIDSEGFYGAINMTYQWERGRFGKRPLANFYGLVYDGEGEMISSKDREMIFVYSIYNENDTTGNDKKTYFYTLDRKTVEQTYPGLFEDLSRSDFSTYYYTIKINDIYIEEDGMHFIPKTIEIHDEGDYEAYFGTGKFIEPKDEIIKTYDLSGCDFTGYVEAPAEGAYVKYIGPLYLDDNVDTTHYDYYMNIKDDSEFLADLQAASNGEYYISKCIHSDLWARGYIINRTNDGSLITVTFVDSDLFRDWLPVLLVEYVITVLIGIIVAAIAGKLRYNRKTVAYEIDSYKRKTTNAMAHDLKSPLMAISGYAENINQNTPKEKIEYYAKNILDTVGDMDKMIANILELSKMEEGSVKLDTTKLQLADIVKDQLAKYTQKMSDKGLKVNISGDSSISGDKEWIEHLIDNLLSNAVKYSAEDSSIDIKMSAKELSISNPMVEELSVPVSKLADQFVKGDNARSNTEGNGLGLSIVKSAVEMQGFDMDISADNKVFVVKIKF